VIRVDQQGTEVRVWVAPETLDAALQPSAKPKTEPKPPRR
jgi:hypothetical protein